jgi:hypothetical protein
MGTTTDDEKEGKRADSNRTSGSQSLHSSETAGQGTVSAMKQRFQSSHDAISNKLVPPSFRRVID